MPRTAAEVFDDHLARADRGDVEGDIAANFSPACVLLTTYGRYDEHACVRAAASLLARQVPEARYQYLQRVGHGEIPFLEGTTYMVCKTNADAKEGSAANEAKSEAEELFSDARRLRSTVGTVNPLPICPRQFLEGRI